MKSLEIFLIFCIFSYSKLNAFENENYLNCKVISYFLLCDGTNSSKVLKNDFLNSFNNTEINSVSFENANISEITVDWTEGLPINSSNWHSINFDSNRLTELKVGVFDTFPVIYQIRLTKNQLICIPAGLFDQNIKLFMINLSFNNLTTLELGVFNKLKQLRDLYLDHNKLVTLPLGLFNETNKLEKLYLANNKLTQFELNHFIATPLLGYLDLGFNPISILEPGISNIFGRLKYLFLNNCNFTELDENLINGMLSLRTFNLSSNFITKLPDNFFSNTSRFFHYFDLSNNSIESLPINYSIPFNFYTVNLGQNKFKKVPLLSGNIGTVTLDLTLNEISTIELKDISNAFVLLSLNIGSNKLTFIETKVRQMLNEVSLLAIEGNPWQCPCWEEIKLQIEDDILNKNYKSNLFQSGELPICFNIENITSCLENEEIRSYPEYNNFLEIMNKTNILPLNSWWPTANGLLLG